MNKDEQLIKQIDETLKNLPLESLPDGLEERVMFAISTTPRVQRMNSSVLGALTGFFMIAIIIAIVNSVLDGESAVFNRFAAAQRLLLSNSLLPVICINLLLGLVLLDKWMRKRLLS